MCYRRELCESPWAWQEYYENLEPEAQRQIKVLNIYTHWGVIPVQVELAGEKSHYILIQLLDASTYQVQHFEFLTPITRVPRHGQWSAAEVETLIKLKRDGLNSQEIYESKRLDERSASAIISSIKALNTRTRQGLLLFANRHHPEGFHDHEQISGADL
jgi:hypothetical protein